MKTTVNAANRIELPTWIGSSNLTIEEIGLLTAVCSLQARTGCPIVTAKVTTPEMQSVMQSLMNRGVIEVRMIPALHRCEIHINFDPVMPPDIAEAKAEADRGEAARAK